jgi:hypothetical protein
MNKLHLNFYNSTYPSDLDIPEHLYLLEALMQLTYFTQTFFN